MGFYNDFSCNAKKIGHNFFYGDFFMATKKKLDAKCLLWLFLFVMSLNFLQKSYILTFYSENCTFYKKISCKKLSVKDFVCYAFKFSEKVIF